MTLLFPGYYVTHILNKMIIRNLFNEMYEPHTIKIKEFIDSE